MAPMVLPLQPPFRPMLAKLAPIIGAFVAGLSLGQTAQAERIRRELELND